MIKVIAIFFIIFLSNLKAEKIINVQILGTTDIHGYLMDYNYYQDKPSSKVGLNKLAILINQLRNENPNTILLDNGDLIQGNPLADYIVQNVSLENDKSPIIKVMEYLKYDAINVGNHEFNYGIKTIADISRNSYIPLISANVFDSYTKKTIFKPYVILEKLFIDNENKKSKIKIGVIGVTPPQIMLWDERHLKDKVFVTDMVEETKKLVKELKKQNVDLIIVLAHSGISAKDGSYKNAENRSFQLTKIKGVDAVITGHQHRLFPLLGDDFPDSKYINNQTGKVNNVPVVMSGSFASHLGVINLKLKFNDKKETWQIIDSSAELMKPDLNSSKVDLNINNLIKKEHQETIKYINKKIGVLGSPVDNYFARVIDNFSIEIVNMAQISYAQSLKNSVLSDYKDIPVIASMAPFKNGGRGGSEYYTFINKGGLSIRNIVDLYVYPNTLVILKISGKQLKEYLEWSSQNFNNIDLQSDAEQQLINTNIPSYNYDVVDGVEYQIDLSVNNRYEGLNLLQKNNNRIKNLTYQGKAVTDNDIFLLVTNNYRASTNTILNRDGKNLVFDSQVSNQEIITNYLFRKKNIIISAVDDNVTLNIPENVKLIFESSANAKNYSDSKHKITKLRNEENGFATYQLEKTDTKK